MKKNNLENKIKDTFDNHQFQLNHDELWENIEPKLKKKKKRRFFFIWFFGGAMLLAFLFIHNFSNEEESNLTLATTLESGPEELDATPLQVHEKEAAATTEVNEELANTSTVAQEKASLLTKAINKVETAGSRTLDDIIMLEPNNLKKSSIPIPTNDIKNEIANPMTQKPRVGNVLENTIENSNIAEVAIIKKSIDNSENGKNKDVAENIADNNFSASNDVNDSSNIEEINNGEKSENRVTSHNKKDKNKPISKIRKSRKKKKKKVKRESDTEEKSKKVRTRHSRRKAFYYAQPTLSYIVPFSSLRSRGGEFSRNLQIRQDTEKRLEAFGFGLNFYRQSRNGFIIVSGIEYQRINTSVGFSSITEEFETIQGVISITENALGQVIDQQLGPKVITKTTIEEQRIFNHHTFINVPVGIGKVWENHKYDFKFSGGLDFNIYHNFKGTIKDVTRDFSFSRRNSLVFESVFKKRTGMGLWMSSEFAKPLTKKTLFWVAPRIQIPFSNVNSEDYNLKQKFFNLNVSVGVSLKLM